MDINTNRNRFKSPANFERSHFESPADFDRYHFELPANFDQKHLELPANSDRNHFELPANFDQKHFELPANSDRNHFEFPANFDPNGPKFPAKLDWNRSEFPANFDWNETIGQLRSNYSLSPPYTIPEMVFISLPIILILIVIVIGNVLVVLAVLSQERLKRRTQNWLIVSLAVADLLVGLLVMPFTLIYELLGQWPFGETFCEIWLALDVLFVTASILNLCAISIDRYLTLTNPVHYSTVVTSPRARIRVYIMITSAWVLAFVICLPPLVGWRPAHQARTEHENATGHGCHVSSDLGYVLYSALGSFFIPLIIVLFIYVKIFFLTRQRIAEQRRKAKEREALLLPEGLAVMNSDEPSVARKHPIPTPHMPPMTPETPETPHANLDLDCIKSVQTTRSESTAGKSNEIGESSSDNTIGNSALAGLTFKAKASICAPTLFLKPLEIRMRIQQQRKGVRKKERRATLVLGLILGAFVLAWMPFFASYILSAICCKTPDLVFAIIFWMGYCNSAFNPFIYNAMNPDFRFAFRHIFYRFIGYFRFGGYARSK